MSFHEPQAASPSPARGAGALLLCRAEPDAVEAVAGLLRERMLLVPAGRGWSALVPEGKPWSRDDEQVDRVLAGWAAALAVGASWPVLALWWDVDHGGCTLAVGFRRAVGYEWLANGMAVGEGEAMRTLAGRLGLDPVLDMQALDLLMEPDAEVDARGRLRALLAVLARVGVALPDDGLGPGEAAGRLCEVARGVAGVRSVEGAGGLPGVRAAEASGEGAGVGVPGAVWGRGLAIAQVGVGVPMVAWGVWRRKGGWVVAGVLMVVCGGLGVAGGIVGRRG